MNNTAGSKSNEGDLVEVYSRDGELIRLALLIKHYPPDIWIAKIEDESQLTYIFKYKNRWLLGAPFPYEG